MKDMIISENLQCSTEGFSSGAGHSQCQNLHAFLSGFLRGLFKGVDPIFNGIHCCGSYGRYRNEH